MLTKKKPASFEERLNAAHATADAAVSVVETIATDLEQAAADKQDIAVEISFEIERLNVVIDDLRALKAEAEEFEAKNLVKAAKIRALVSA